MRRNYHSSNRPAKFDPLDSINVKHTHIGVWDLYEELQPSSNYLQQWSSSLRNSYYELITSLPYVWRMLKDIGRIRSCWSLLSLYLVIEISHSLLPAIQLWFSGQLLSIVETALEERRVDKHLLVKVATGRLLCSVIKRLLMISHRRVEEPLNKRIKQHYTIHYFRTVARLDLPTFEDAAVQRQLEQALPRTSRSSIAWDTVVVISNAGTTALLLASEFMVLLSVLTNQRDGFLLAFVSFIHSFMQWLTRTNFIIWAATTKDPDYTRTEGLKQAVTGVDHRKEIVAGNMWRYLLAQYTFGIQRVADRAGDFFEVLGSRRTSTQLSPMNILRDAFQELPQVIFTLRAVQYPASVPVTLASLNLITQTANSFTITLLSLFDDSGSVLEKLASVRKLYQITELPNKISDGKLPYPENHRSLELGMSIEFRNVSFKYPDTDIYALSNVSFKIEKGQLCVIVGANGSGKSTILKLIARLYDVTEGQILIDGINIKSLRLDGLRRAISVLFQDYTHFPLSIRDNIGLGDPEHADDDEKIQEAARLGGAAEFISRLPEDFDTYLERPVQDYYSNLPEGTTTLFGRPVDYTNIRNIAGMETTVSKSLSGGQMQRIALSRTFMRSLVSEPPVGLLLFDEPSASLDPTAEHDLFERLRQLRGNKTMVFSSHRFGNLTRHADIILYINDSVVVEEGTHSQLLERNGEYARIWRLQAQAFL
ncbi:hypothetical protein AMATHDRAFT_75408 [Amanita thiersii Skay4041]|uniref:ABC transporter domain-containing protein n=1 Tax=Amanita thiersii Skay4041 TaxID=703135 RepID=A0A2A9NJE7_9AGAR|nr:hypothetical protein AMATHDRAFT_75408 [Amanita thiersii Skay4041]